MRLFLGLFLLPFALYADNTFTIDQALSAPFPSELVANGHGKVAWTQDAAGVRSIWVAESPSYEGRQIPIAEDDDGQEISEISVSGDGAWIVFTRGTGANSRGEFPNPRHVAAGVEQTVFAVPFVGGAPKELGKGHGAAISPDGKTVAFVASGQVWTAPVDGGAKAAQWIHARGTAESLNWSPDGKFLAMTSSRALHAFIAVYEVGANTVRYLDPSTDEDAFPVWAPDSKHLAFVRRPTIQEEEDFGAKRVAESPWSLRVADVDTAQGHEVWRAQPGPGSEFRGIDGHHQVLWTADGKLVFPWERTGWLHLYSVLLAGGVAADLTPGAFEVEHVSLSDDGKSVLYSSNQDDIDRRHVWRVSPSGGAAQRVTSGADLEWAPVSAGADVVLLRSDPRMPGRASVVTRSGVRDLTPALHDFPAAALVEPQPVVFPAADGMQIHGQLFLPHDGKAKHPAVIFFHGGSRRQMLLGWHYMFYYHQAYGFNQYLANHGYVVLSVNYRSGIGYGLNFREALSYGATGGSEYNDVIGAGLYLRARGDVESNKIGLWGGSYGGYLTALGLARASDLFAAGVDLHGVHDWNEELQNYAPIHDAQKRTEMARVAFLSSPMAYMSTWKSPVLLIQGDDDRNVVFKQTLMLAQALRRQGVPMEELIFPDEVHDFLTHEHWLAAYHAADAFLAKYLKPGMTE